MVRVSSAMDDVDAASVTDTQKRRWLVRAPRTALAGARLHAEARLLQSLTGLLPFTTPQVAGTVVLRNGSIAVVHRAMPGRPLEPGELTPGPGLAAGLGRAIAAIHELPSRVIEDAGMPIYGAADYRQRRMAEVDRAATTGKVPPALLTRWEHALDEAAAWRFVPAVVHGDLAAESVLVEDGAVSGIVDWAEARVADPADDLAWIAVGADADALETVVEAYAVARREIPDPHVARRARLAGELAMARWLMHGVTAKDDEVVDDAVAMLRDLAESVADSPW